MLVGSIRTSTFQNPQIFMSSAGRKEMLTHAHVARSTEQTETGSPRCGQPSGAGFFASLVSLFQSLVGVGAPAAQSAFY
jgi:hypothetical protein